MTNFKPGDRVVCGNNNGWSFNLVEGQVYEVASTLEVNCQPAIELAQGKGTWFAHRFKKENNMTKIKLSTGVEATLHGYGDVTLPGDYMTNTSFLEASGVTWEPLREIEEVAFEDLGRQHLGREIVGGYGEITNVDIYQDDVYVYSTGNEHPALEPGDIIKLYK